MKKNRTASLRKAAALICAAAVCLLIPAGSSPVSADYTAENWPDGGPVIGEGEFVPDPEMEAIIAEKEAAIFIPNNDWPDGGPVIGEGEFVPDPEMLAIIAEKEAAIFFPNDDWPDGGPVIGEGEFVPDPEMLAIIAEKEAALIEE